jgi:hypothetical protein
MRSKIDYEKNQISKSTDDEDIEKKAFNFFHVLLI